MNNILKEIRVKHWLKNLFVLAPFLFTPEKWSPLYLYFIILGLLAFSFVSSSVYILNDLHDVDADRKNNINSIRPYAAGLLNNRTMYLLFIIFFLLSIIIGTAIKTEFALVIVSYLLLNLLYTYYFKKINYINYSVVALGFVLRVLGGCVIVSVTPSIWIVILTFLLTYFISIVKSYINSVKRESDFTQIKILATIIPIIYLFYTISSETIRHFDTKLLVISILPVAVGFIYTIYKIKKEEKRDIVNFFTDKIYWCIYLSWLLIVSGIIGKNYFLSL